MECKTAERYGKKSIVVQAENFGFGPASIALSVLRRLRLKGIDDYEVIFMGNGVALQLAKTSNDVDRYVNIDTVNMDEMEQRKYLLGKVQMFISVVSPTGAIFAKRAGYKTCYIEPLFWYFDSMDKRLLDIDYFFVQRLTDTRMEMKRLNFYHKNLIEVGWIVQEKPERNKLKSLIRKFCKPDEETYFKQLLDEKEKDYVLINFGGVDNCISDVSIYPKVILKSLIPVVRKSLPDTKILIIGGGVTLQGLRCNDSEKLLENVWVGTVPNEWSLFLVKYAKEYFLSCGLSGLIEMGLYRQDGFGLPSQNSSQHMQIKKFRELYKEWSGFEYCDYDTAYNIPEYLNEAEGVRILHEAFEEFAGDVDKQALFQKSVEKYLNKSAEGKQFKINKELHMENTQGADEIADIIYKDLYKENYPNMIFAEKANEDVSLFRAEYKNTIEEFVEGIKDSCELLPSRIEDRNLENGFNNVWILNKDSKEIPETMDAITGGPCICYCEGDENRLSLQDVMDIIMPVLAAKTWSTDLYFVFTGSEASMQVEEDSGLSCYDEYMSLSKKVENFIFKLTQLINYDKKRIHFINTSNKKANQVLEELCGEFSKHASKESLNELYYFKSKEFGEAPKKEEYFLDVYVRNIMMYTPQFLSACAGKELQSVAVVENSTQLKAIIEGFNFARKIGFDGFLGHYAYLAFPGTTGIEMARSEVDKCIFLGDSLKEIETKLNSKMRTFIKNYYEAFVPSEIRTYLLKENVSQTIYKLFQLVKEYMKTES